MKQLEESGVHPRTVVALVDPQRELLDDARKRFSWAEVVAVGEEKAAPLNPWFTPRVYKIDSTGRLIRAQEGRAATAKELGEAIDGLP